MGPGVSQAHQPVPQVIARLEHLKRRHAFGQSLPIKLLRPAKEPAQAWKEKPEQVRAKRLLPVDKALFQSQTTGEDAQVKLPLVIISQAGPLAFILPRQVKQASEKGGEMRASNSLTNAAQRVRTQRSLGIALDPVQRLFH